MFKAHRLLYHSTLGSRVIQEKKETCQTRLRSHQPSESEQIVEHSMFFTSDVQEFVW